MMEPPNRAGPPRVEMDAAGGRKAPSNELVRRLSSAPPAFIGGALENPELTEAAVIRLLLNRRATRAHLERIGRDPRWTTAYEIKKRLVQHPNTPPTAAKRLVPQLYWQDLADAFAVPGLDPSVKRRIEQALQARLDGLALGEQVALARRVSRALVPALCRSREDRVLRGLLENRRLYEDDAVRLASDPESPPGFLGHLATHPEWGNRQAIRVALVTNPATPIQAALRIVDELPKDDLHRLSNGDNVPRIVRVGATRALAKRRAVDSRDRSEDPSGDPPTLNR